MSQLPPAPWGKPWFHQKTYGYGSGLPCSWEGWATLLGFVVAMAIWADLANRYVGGLGSPLGVIGAIVLGGVLALFCWGRTPGGWSKKKTGG